MLHTEANIILNANYISWNKKGQKSLKNTDQRVSLGKIKLLSKDEDDSYYASVNIM